MADQEKLVDGCRRNNRMSQLEFYRKYCNAMFQVACRYLQNEEDAKDAMQEGFLKFFLQINNYKGQVSIGSWLKRIIINCCIDMHRKKKVEFESLDGGYHQLGDDTFEDLFGLTIDKQAIVRAMDRLPIKYGLVVKMYLVEGYDHEEISAVLQIPITTSRTQLRRGKQMLKEQLERKYHELRKG